MTNAAKQKHVVTRRQLALSGLSMSAAVALSPATAHAAPAPRLTLDDRAAIQDLFTRYLWAYDCTDEEEFAALFTDDALVVGKSLHYVGKPAILGWFRYLVEMREREGDDIWMHEAGQFRFQPAGKDCLVYAYATHFNANSAKAMRGVRSLGYFVCECTRTEAGWLFRRFSISPWDSAKLPWKKPLPWAEAPQS